MWFKKKPVFRLRICSEMRERVTNNREIVMFFTTPVYVLYVLYVTNRGQSKVVGALRAPTNNCNLDT
jgi:hypothetical protein